MEKKSIFGLDLNKPASVLVRELRDKLISIRGQFDDVITEYPRHKSDIEPMDGLLTTAIKTLYHDLEKITEYEIEQDDKQHGRSLPFHSSGIVLDHCHGCFVCGGEAKIMNNISAFVDTKKNGYEIVSWFKHGAFFSFRTQEPNWIQVTVGSCDNHLDNLKNLHKSVCVHAVIRQSMITSAMKYTH